MRLLAPGLLHLFTAALLAALAAAVAPVAAPVAMARPATQRVNVREACRQVIAGAYLKSYDERERSKTYIRALATQLQEFEAAVAKSRVELARLEKETKAETFEIGLATRRDEAAAAVRSYEAQIAEARGLQRQAAATLDQQVVAEAQLRTAIDKVFIFERMDDKPDGGYPLALKYRSDCPKYRHLCPLPAKDVELLLAIRPGGAVPEECQRYASLSHIR